MATFRNRSGKVQKAALKTVKQVISSTANGRMPVDAGVSEIAKTLTTITPQQAHQYGKIIAGWLNY